MTTITRTDPDIVPGRALDDEAATQNSPTLAVRPEYAPRIEIKTACCFCAGTRILTDAGEVAVETLSVGDKVATHSGRYRAIKWIGRRSHGAGFAAPDRSVLPICIRAGALADNIPVRDLLVSPEHAMYLSKGLVEAKRLVNGRNVIFVEAMASIEYFHIELDTHDVIFAEGAAAESCRGMFQNGAEVAQLHPEAGPPQGDVYAPILTAGRKLAAIQRKILARAGAVSEAAPGGEIQGYLEVAQHDLIYGWAWRKDQDTAIVTLDVLDNDAVIATLGADEYRVDLADAGIGNGRHGFKLRLTKPLDPGIRHVITVRARSSGTVLTGAPAIIEPASTIDATVIEALRGKLSLATAQLSSTEEAEALLGMLSAKADALRQHQAILRGTAASNSKPRGTGAKRSGRHALVIDDVWPRSDHDAGAQAIISHMRALQKLGWHVSFIARTGATVDIAAITALQEGGITCLSPPAYATVDEALARQAGQFELVYLHRITVASPYASLVRHYQPQARLIYSVADLHHLRLARQSHVEARPELWSLASRFRAQEGTAMRQADAVITHSPAEASYLLAEGLVAPARLHTLPWTVPVRGAGPNLTNRHGLLFVANFGHDPNRDGLEWLLQEVLPPLRATRPDMALTIAGFGLRNAMSRALATHTVEVLGHVTSLAPLYHRARVAVAPLRFGAGLKGKVLEAWSYGVPCAMTPIAAEGLPQAEPITSAIADGTNAFVASILALYEDTALSSAHVAAGRHLLRTHFSAASVTAMLGQVLDKTGAEIRAMKPDGA